MMNIPLFIQERLRHTQHRDIVLPQPCEHGWACTKCHWEAGQTEYATASARSHFLRAIFGYSRHDVRKEETFCGETLCWNPAHIQLICEFRGWTLEQHFFHYCAVCVHGYTCRTCCWLWYGTSFVYPVIRRGHGSPVQARDVMVSLFFPRKLVRGERIRGCVIDVRCLQPGHFVPDTIAVKGKRGFKFARR
jgi:hypothetical protein